MIGLNGGTDLWQQKIRRTIRRANPDLPGQGRFVSPPFLLRAHQMHFGLSRQRHHPLAQIRQRISLR